MRKCVVQAAVSAEVEALLRRLAKEDDRSLMSFSGKLLEEALEAKGFISKEKSNG